jgi:hypothetical protein
MTVRSCRSRVVQIGEGGDQHEPIQDRAQQRGCRNSDLTADDGQETVITDTHTGKTAKGLDWASFKQSDRKAWEALKKK